MTLERTTHKGLKIFVDSLSTENSRITARVGVGSLHETEKNAGLSHVLEHCVHIGTKLFKDEEVQLNFTGINALEYNANTSYEDTSYFGIGPYVEPNIQRLGEMLFRATLPKKALKNELKLINQEARENREKMNSIHETASTYALFGKPFGRDIIGYADKLEFSRTEILEFYKKHYVSSNMAIIAVGNVRMEELIEHIDNYFDLSDLAAPVTEVKHPGSPKATMSGLELRAVDNAEVRVATPLDPAFVERFRDNKILFETVTQAMSNYCFKRFRGDTGLAYDAGVDFYDSNSPLAWSIGANAEVAPSNTRKAGKMLLEALSRPGADYTDSSIASAIGNTKSWVLESMDSKDTRTGFYAQALDQHTEPTDLKIIAQTAHSLTIEQVRNGIDEVVEYISKNPPITHVTGPTKAVKHADRIFTTDRIA